MLTAITRPPSEALADCLLTHMDREPIDLARAQSQHTAYRALLDDLGAEVVALPPSRTLPDAVFVEDNALVLPEVTVLCRMSDAARAPEVDSIEEALAQRADESRRVRRIAEPGTLEGGDTVLVGRTVFVGLSTRTNEAGAEQLRILLEPFDYDVRPVAVTGCLHLSTGASHIGDGLITANPEWVDVSAIRSSPEPGLRVLHAPSDEPWSANAMRIGDTVVIHAGHTSMGALLQSEGLDVRSVDISEFMKAEAGLTCMRLLFDAAPVRTKGRDAVRDRITPSFRMTG